jgi:DNA-binding MarR family transcriptional regulator
MGRQFDVSRQAASKIVAELRGDGYVRTTASSTDQREKVVELTPQAIAYVTARLRAAADVDTAIRTRLGDDGFDKLREALQAVGEVAGETTEFDPFNNYRSPKLW